MTCGGECGFCLGECDPVMRSDSEVMAAYLCVYRGYPPISTESLRDIPCDAEFSLTPAEYVRWVKKVGFINTDLAMLEMVYIDTFLKPPAPTTGQFFNIQPLRAA